MADAKWEYQTVQIPRGRGGSRAESERERTVDELNRLGAEGFEAFAAVVGWTGPDLLVLLKRPVG